MNDKLHVIWVKVWEIWREMYSDDDFLKLLMNANAKLGKMGGSKANGKFKVSSNVPPWQKIRLEDGKSFNEYLTMHVDSDYDISENISGEFRFKYYIFPKR